MNYYDDYEDDDHLMDQEVCPACGSTHFVFNYEIDKLECGDCGFIPNHNSGKHKTKKNMDEILIKFWEKKNFKGAPYQVLDILYNLKTPRK